MKIVCIIDFFHPNAGYQLNVLSKYFVKFGYECYIITGKIDKIDESLTSFFGKDDLKFYDKEFEKNTGVKIIRLPLLAFISGRAIFDKKLFKTIKNLRPDILYVHDVDTFVGIQYVLSVKKYDFPIIFNSTMLEMASVNPFAKQFRWFYKNFITPKIIKNNLKVIRIQDDPYLEKCLGIPLNQCPFISVGSDTMLFHPDYDVKLKFRKEYELNDDDFVVVYTGKLTESKGAKLLADVFSRKFENTKKKNVVLLVVGNTVGEYGKEIESIFERSENRIIRFPTQKYMDLAKYYQVADLSVFPKECSLSFYDAQACGLPVLSEDNNVNIDRLKYNNGYNFKKGNINDFRQKVIDFLEMEQEKYYEMSNNAYNFVLENYNYEKIAKQYLDILIEEKNYKRNS